MDRSRSPRSRRGIWQVLSDGVTRHLADCWRISAYNTTDSTFLRRGRVATCEKPTITNTWYLLQAYSISICSPPLQRSEHGFRFCQFFLIIRRFISKTARTISTRLGTRVQVVSKITVKSKSSSKFYVGVIGGKKFRKIDISIYRPAVNYLRFRN